MEPLFSKARGKMKRLPNLAWRLKNLQHPVHELWIARILYVEAPTGVAISAIEFIIKTNSAGDAWAMPRIDDAWYAFAIHHLITLESEINQITIAAKACTEQVAYLWKSIP